MLSNINREKLEAVSKMYGMRIYRECLDILGDRVDAEDAVQDTYIKILHYIDRIDDIRSAPAKKYISLAAKSAAKNVFKMKKRAFFADPECFGHEDVEELIEMSVVRISDEDEYARRSCIDSFEKYAGILNDADLAILEYHTEEVRTLKETAEHFGITYAALRKRVQRLRRRIDESRGVRGTDADK